MADENQQIKKEIVEKRLKEFTEYFVDEFETRIEFYRKILEEKGDNKSGASSVISGSKQAISGGVSFATGIPFLGPIIGAIYEQGGKKIANTYEEKRGKTQANSLYDLLYDYKENLTYKKLIVEICYEIFYSYESQFLSVKCLKGGETRAMLKLAKTSVAKILEYLINNSANFSAKTVIEAIVSIEESALKKYVSIFKVGRTVYKDDKPKNTKLNTLNLLTKCGLHVEDQFYSKNDLEPQTFGFRRPTSYEDKNFDETYFKVDKVPENLSYTLSLEEKDLYVNLIYENLTKRDPKLMEERVKTTLTGVEHEILKQIESFKEFEASSVEGLKTYLKDLHTDVLNEICLYYIKGKTLFDLAQKDRNEKHEKTITILGQNSSNLGEINTDLKETLSKVTYIHNHVIIQEKKPIIFNFYPPKLFVGRQNELNELNETVSKNKIVVLNGQRGIGKTELVKKLVQNKKIEGAFNIIWLNCDTNDILIQNFKELAMLLGFNMVSKTNLTLIEEVFSYFKDKSTIFVFDHCRISTLFVNNLTDLVQIGDKTSIILVSTSKNWNETYHVISLSTWSPEDATEYVKQVLTSQILTDITFTDSDYQNLAEFHDFLPYSLQQATSFIVQLNNLHKKPFTIDDYCRKYGESEVVPLIEQPPVEHPDSDDDGPIEKVIGKKIEAEAKRFQKRVAREGERIGDQISDGAAHLETQVKKIFKKLF